MILGESGDVADSALGGGPKGRNGQRHLEGGGAEVGIPLGQTGGEGPWLDASDEEANHHSC